jgi:uncharacterized protein (DUF2164 family)
MIRKWDTENKPLHQKCVGDVIARVQEIHDPETAGILVAQDIIDIVLENFGPEIYNKAIEDTATLLRDKFQEIEYSAQDLKQL